MPLQLGESVVRATDDELPDGPARDLLVDDRGRPAKMSPRRLFVTALEAADLGRRVDRPLLVSLGRGELVDRVAEDPEKPQVGAVDEGEDERLWLVVCLHELADAWCRAESRLVADAHRKVDGLDPALLVAGEQGQPPRCGPVDAVRQPRLHRRDVGLDRGEDRWVASGTGQPAQLVGEPLERVLVVGRHGSVGAIDIEVDAADNRLAAPVGEAVQRGRVDHVMDLVHLTPPRSCALGTTRPRACARRP